MRKLNRRPLSFEDDRRDLDRSLNCEPRSCESLNPRDEAACLDAKSSQHATIVRWRHPRRQSGLMGNSSGSVYMTGFSLVCPQQKLGLSRRGSINTKKTLQSFHRTTIFCSICCYLRHLFVNETMLHTHFIITTHTMKTNVLHARLDFHL